MKNGRVLPLIIIAGTILTLSAQENNLCNDITGWNLKAGWSITKDGPGGENTVKLERTDPSVFNTIGINCTDLLKPGQKYVIKCDIKTDNIVWKTKETSGLTVGLEFWKGNKHSSSAWIADVRGTKEWKTYSKEVTVPVDFDRASLNVFLGRERTGTAWLRNFSIHEIKKP